MKHKITLNILFVFALITSCKKGDDEPLNPTAGTKTSTTQVSYFQLSPDTFFNPVISKYSLPTGSYVVKAIGKNNGPEMYIYFKGTEPTKGSKYVLIDSRYQTTLNEGEAFIRFISNGTTFFNYSHDTLTIVSQENKKIVEAKGIYCATEKNTDSRTVSLKIQF